MRYAMHYPFFMRSRRSCPHPNPAVWRESNGTAPNKQWISER
jgi:hypothetical protein